MNRWQCRHCGFIAATEKQTSCCYEAWEEAVDDRLNLAVPLAIVVAVVLVGAAELVALWRTW